MFSLLSDRRQQFFFLIGFYYVFFIFVFEKYHEPSKLAYRMIFKLVKDNNLACLLFSSFFLSLPPFVCLSLESMNKKWVSKFCWRFGDVFFSSLDDDEDTDDGNRAKRGEGSNTKNILFNQQKVFLCQKIMLNYFEPKHN